MQLEAFRASRAKLDTAPPPPQPSVRDLEEAEALLEQYERFRALAEENGRIHIVVNHVGAGVGGLREFTLRMRRQNMAVYGVFEGMIDNHEIARRISTCVVAPAAASKEEVLFSMQNEARCGCGVS